MYRWIPLSLAAIPLLAAAQMSFAQEVLFEDAFDGTLSPKWSVVGLKEDDYRIKNGCLEMRVQPGNATKDTPMLIVLLPFETSETVTASVDLTLIDRFTEPSESAGLFLTDEDSREFGAEKMNLNGHLVFSPGDVEFIGKEGTEGDPQQYALKFWLANDDFGSLRIIVRGNYGFFQVGPSTEGNYLNFFHSAIRPKEPKRGFCLSASGGPSDKDHWVRFDNFRVVRD
ncbi:MAG: hypothetical protein ACKVT0_03535 [Planctomycetaceae bacterium]